MAADTKEPALGNNIVRSNGGYELVLAALLMGLFGWWLDGQFGTRPFFMLALSILGFVGSAAAIYYRFQSSLARIKAETAELKAKARG